MGASSAHYGLAFRLQSQRRPSEAAQHPAFARPPKGPDADRWVQHAEGALRKSRQEAPESS